MRLWARMTNELSDSQRRWLCRTGFVVAAVVPLVLVVALILRTDARSEWETQCSLALGLKTRIADVETLTPHQHILSDVEISDSEAGWVARIDRVQITRHEDRWSVLVDQTTIRPELLARIIERLQSSLQIPATRQDDIEISMRGVHWSQSQDSATPQASWDRVTWFRRAGPDGVTLTGKLSPAGSDELSPIELRFEHARSSTHALTQSVAGAEATPTSATTVDRKERDWSVRCVVNTNDHAIDLAWLELSGWKSQGWGDEASFAGEFEYSLGVDGTVSCELAGDLLDVDLRRLVGERFRHVMEGRATLSCKRLRIEQGRLMELAGSIESNQGIIGLPLLRSLAGELQLQVSPAVEAMSDASVAFKELGVRFELTGETLALSGFDTTILAYGSSNEVLIAVGQSLALRPQDLVRALVPDSNLQVPLTRETAELLSWFPVPSRAELEPTPQTAPRGIPLMIER